MGDEQGINKPVNPLLAGIKKLPGLSILLPTKGLLYTDGELDEKSLKSGEVHIHPMSAKDELVLKSPDLLINGEALRMVVTRCVPDVLKPLELFQADLDSILVGIRIATYGDNLGITVENPYFDENLKGSRKEMDYEIPLKPLLTNAKFLKDLEECKVELETGQIATVQPLRFKTTLTLTEEDLMELPEDHEKRNAVFRRRMETFEEILLSMISNIDGISDKEMIKEWYQNVPAGIFAKLSEKAMELGQLGIKMETTLTDPITKKSWEASIPINPADFFGTGPSKKTGLGF